MFQKITSSSLVTNERNSSSSSDAVVYECSDSKSGDNQQQDFIKLDCHVSKKQRTVSSFKNYGYDDRSSPMNLNSMYILAKTIPSNCDKDTKDDNLEEERRKAEISSQNPWPQRVLLKTHTSVLSSCSDDTQTASTTQLSEYDVYLDNTCSSSSYTTESSSKSQLETAKSNLMSLLQEYNGSTKNPKVLNAIRQLSELNPTTQPAMSSNILGRWKIISEPEFPQCIKGDSDHPMRKRSPYCKYTLGRLSFGLFQPQDLICSIVSIEAFHEEYFHDALEEISDEEENGKSQQHQNQKEQEGCRITYPVTVNIIIHTDDGYDLPAVIDNRGYCYPQNETRLGVNFTGGSLRPANSVLCDVKLLSVWKNIFKKAYSDAESKKTYVRKLSERFVNWMLQLTTPSDLDDSATQFNNNYSFHFEMKRCPTGHIDILYLDDDIRITKGNKGSYVIVQREEDPSR